MDLSLSDDELLLRDSVRSFVAREANTETLVGLQPSRLGLRPEWTAPMADAGWLGALVPEKLGGSGASTLEAAIICEELGRGPVPGPFLVSSVLAVGLLRVAAASPERDHLLSAIATGNATVVPVTAGSGRDWNGLRAGGGFALEPFGPVGEGGEGGGVLTCTAPFVPYAAAATHLLVPVTRTGAGDDAGAAGNGGVELAVVPVGAEGVSVRRLKGFLAWNDEVTFTNVTIEPGNLLRLAGGGGSQSGAVGLDGEDGEAGLDDVLTQAYVLFAAYQVGGCQRLLERSIDYSNTRQQFGQAIGRFQRVQDHLVELLNATDAARWTMYEAIWRIDSGQPARAAAHLAKAVASESYLTAADYAHKVHGGIGVDPTSGITLFTQMSRSLYELLGTPRWHKRRMADALEWSTS
ncbi:Acyl-CoA dehydrogenase [Parafrankia irregularis]|uniref:Acyl-CoA dehydrogenase n=1 Tax=Parafrankia irregularis TaxID=795642 RepID=A0A0S4QXX8_9ACTN|nr:MULTISPECIES: acyl-CoA dehydrogenase family protein [Parafrankia]MBE3199950.1 acyl-CoA/acyl-ACP dehydrogenase [Parafrankia sp. CH37]CUU59306.1 Acyl-CoA dehydrogenase [Parafrankia irregularis]